VGLEEVSVSRGRYPFFFFSADPSGHPLLVFSSRKLLFTLSCERKALQERNSLSASLLGTYLSGFGPL